MSDPQKTVSCDRIILVGEAVVFIHAAGDWALAPALVPTVGLTDPVAVWGVEQSGESGDGGFSMSR